MACSISSFFDVALTEENTVMCCIILVAAAAAAAYLHDDYSNI